MLSKASYAIPQLTLSRKALEALNSSVERTVNDVAIPLENLPIQPSFLRISDTTQPSHKYTLPH